MDTSQDKYAASRKMLVTIIGILTIVPLAPLVNRYVPPIIIGKWNFDLLVSIIAATVLTWLVLRLFRFLVMPAFVLCLLVLVYNQLTDGYGFKSMINDYRSMVVNNWGRKEEKEINLRLKGASFFEGPLAKTVSALRSKVNYQDSVVRNFSVRHSLQYFDDYLPKYGTIVRYLSLFKYVNAHFKYVPDSERDEYFATPRETILNGLGGDCDDHSILMVSCMESIGARCRMVLTKGHLYPELFCGDRKSFERMQQAIVHLFADEDITNIYYHEQAGQYWINLDYTAPYPGGPYMSNVAFSIIE